MHPDSGTSQKDDPNNVLDAKALLAIDGGMITGILFFLTLSSFVTGTDSVTGRVLVGVVTLSLVTIFAISALYILPFRMRFRSKKYPFLYSEDKKPNLKSAKRITYFGFLYLPLYLAMIVFTPLLPSGIQLLEDVEEQCAKSPESFNVSATPWKCSLFSLGSLAEQCTKNPERYRMLKSECHQLIPPS